MGAFQLFLRNSRHAFCNELELRIAIGMLFAFDRLPVRLQAVSALSQ